MSVKLPRMKTSWYVPLLVSVLMLAGLALWAMPSRVQHVVADPAGGPNRTVTFWDTSRWQSIAAHWWEALLLGLVALGLSIVTWQSRSWLFVRASAARFFVASLMIHGLLLLWLWGLPVAQAVVEHAEVIRVSQSNQMLDDPQPAVSGGRANYDKVADLPAEDKTAPDLTRQVATPADVPDDVASLEPTIPAHAVRTLPPERLLFVPPRDTEIVRRPLDIERHSGAVAIRPAEIKLDLPEPPAAEPSPREEPIEIRRVAQGREGPTAPTPGSSAPQELPTLKRPQVADLRPDIGASPKPNRTGMTPDALPSRRSQSGILTPAAPREPAVALKTETSPTDRPPTGAGTALPRTAPAALVPSPLPDEPAGPGLPRTQPLDVGIAKTPPIEGPPRLDPLPDRLPRTLPRIDREAKIAEKTTPPTPFILRPEEVRQRSVKEAGGTEASEAAVARGLDWLAAHQNPDGSWGLHNFQANCKHPACTDAGSVHSDPAGTGIALLPFLGAGHTPESAKHGKTVKRAIQWLVEQQRVDGTWLAPQDPKPMYGHAIATIALCEAYGMTRDPKLLAPAQKAIDYIVKSQSAAGGWRYRANQDSDTSVTGWQLMALKSAEMAGLKVPPATFDGVKRWLASVEGNKPVGGQFGYQSASPTPAMTAQGLLCLEYLGTRRDDPRMRAGISYLLGHLPQAGSDTSYYWYNANQVMYHVQGKEWKTWNGKLRDLLVSTQIKDGTMAGSWKPSDSRETPGGRLYATALRLLMLEVYYRHLPLYQQLDK